MSVVWGREKARVIPAHAGHRAAPHLAHLLAVPDCSALSLVGDPGLSVVPIRVVSKQLGQIASNRGMTSETASLRSFFPAHSSVIPRGAER